jgi:hypothetical protein
MTLLQACTSVNDIQTVCMEPVVLIASCVLEALPIVSSTSTLQSLLQRYKQSEDIIPYITVVVIFLGALACG